MLHQHHQTFHSGSCVVYRHQFQLLLSSRLQSMDAAGAGRDPVFPMQQIPMLLFPPPLPPPLAAYSSSSSSATSHHPSATSFPILVLTVLGILTISVLLLTYYVFVIRCCLNWHSSSDTLYLISRRRGRASSSLPVAAVRGAPSEARGLEESAIQALPAFRYRKAIKSTVDSSECAVCLSEFEDKEQLRFLPKCSHAFHPDCIGEWLASHVTCPVCRCNLDPNKDTSSDEPSFPAPEANSTSSEISVVRQEDGGQPAAVVIDVVTEEEDEERRKEAMELQQIGSQRRAMRPRSGRRPVTAQLVRSHSTGHSLAIRLDRDLERFTLRLPEHVRREMVAAGEQSLRRGRRVGEGSSRGGRSDRLGRSGRWPSFLTRTFSGRLPFFSASRRADSSDGGEVSTSSSTKVKGKRVAAVDVVDGSSKGSVRLDRIGGSESGAQVGAVACSAAPTVDMEKATTRQVRT